MSEQTTHDRDYLERTIATVRNHRGAENCWPQWANIFADEIEQLWERVDTLQEPLRTIELWPVDDPFRSLTAREHMVRIKAFARQASLGETKG